MNMGVWNLTISDEEADEAYQEFVDGWEHEYEFTDDLPELDEQKSKGK